MAAAGLTQPRCASERGLAMGGERTAERRFMVGAARNPWLGATVRCSRTGSSNPSPSSAESANFRSLARLGNMTGSRSSSPEPADTYLNTVVAMRDARWLFFDLGNTLVSERRRPRAVSNGSTERLTKWGLMPFISACLSSAELGLEKPDPGSRDASRKR